MEDRIVSTQLILALLVLPLMLGAAYGLQRGNRLKPAMLLVITTPLAMVLAYIALNREPHVTEGGGNAAHPTPAPASEPQSTSDNSEPAVGGRVAQLRAEAEEARRGKNFKTAAERFDAITKASPFDPDAWADLGDAEAAAAGGDLDAGAAAIDRALELDAEHPKALWLKASLRLQHKDYKSAAELWQRLLKVLPVDSSDAKIVKTNLDEATRLSRDNGARP
jgi:cytochrome c-type biogenesis protein CcmH/NrfG